MAKTWTAERDQKLLLLLLEQINVNGGIAAATASAWKKNYGEFLRLDESPIRWSLT